MNNSAQTKRTEAEDALWGNEADEIDFNPLWDYCLILPIKKEKTAGGIILPDGSRQDDTPRARVLKVGPGAYRDNGTFVPNPIKPGDIVFSMGFTKPHAVIIKGKLYLCISSRDCVAVAKSV